MTDVETKTPTKRKNVANVQGKKASAKKAKLDNAKTFQKNISPKQKQNIKGKKNSESENDSPKKLKPFPGTKPASNKVQKNVKKTPENSGVEGGEKKKKRKSQYYNLTLKIKSDQKQEALQAIETRLKEMEGRKELSKTARRKLKLLQKLKRVAEGQEPLARPQQQKADTTKREKNKNAKKLAVEAGSKNKLNKVAASQQSVDVKTNGKANKNLKPQNKKAPQKPLPKQVEEEEDDSDEGESDDEDVEEEEDDDDESGDEEEVEGEDESGEEDEEEDGESNDDEEESDEDESEEESPPPPKVSNKKQKKK